MLDANGQLQALAPDLWVVDRRQRFFGLEVGTRMTVIRLAGERLLLCSPVALDAALQQALDALGAVCFVVAPNRLHQPLRRRRRRRLSRGALAGRARAAWANAPTTFAAVLGDEAPAEWRDEIAQVFFRGRPTRTRWSSSTAPVAR
ncbi:MAG: hypothetical protein U0802_07450 [Candidatus Binatia bacterium]